MNVRSWSHFAAIDWSGAAGERHKGIAIATCGTDGPPMIVQPGHRWSRGEVLDWLINAMPDDTLVGLDLSGSMPFADVGAYFPDWDESPADARGLWALVERYSATDPHFSASSFVDHVEAARYFRRHGGRRGDRFGDRPQGRFRVTEDAQRALGCRPYSNLNLVGAAQVGKSSLTGMRVLHRLQGRLPLWPFDAVPATGSLVVEIYTTIAAIAAGRAPGRSKMRDYSALNEALAALASPPVLGAGPIEDHASDALLTAAWLRNVHADDALWHPPGLDDVRHTEGWTFGAR
ncbi:MAG TPA: hypothetical protein VL405_06505 [Sphingomonas sp.]|nr:hypothetical protein [Sphingomonas sp.]